MTWDIAAPSDLNMALPASAPPPSVLVAGGSAPPGGFATVLAGAAPAAPPAGADRQALAAPGNFLPPLVGVGDPVVGDDADKDGGDDAAAPDKDSADGSDLLAWWPGAVPPEPAPPPPEDKPDAALVTTGAPPPKGGDATTLSAADAGDDATGDPALAPILTAGADTGKAGNALAHDDRRAGSAPPPPSANDDGGSGAPVPDAIRASAAPVVLAGLPGGDPLKGAAGPAMPDALAKNVKPVSTATLAVDDARSGADPLKQAGPGAIATPSDDKTAGPAGQVFAARIGAALDTPAPRSGKRGGASASVDPLNLLSAMQSGAATPLTARPVMGAAAADLPVIQASDPEWIEKFVDQIDMLRGDDGSRETRIRLSPDALGTLDVRIAQRDGRTEVHINADQAGARALLADAAPRLADLAQARGLKLNTSFADGQGQPSQRQDQGAPTQRAPRLNDAAAPADAQTDERIG